MNRTNTSHPAQVNLYAPHWDANTADLSDWSEDYADGLNDGAKRGIDVAKELITRLAVDASPETLQRVNRMPSVLWLCDADAGPIAAEMLACFAPARSEPK